MALAGGNTVRGCPAVSAEFDERTNRALAARTYGELDDVLQGLGGLPRKAAHSHPLRKVAFWVVTVVSSPSVFLGSMLTAFGDNGDEVGIGLVLLVLTLPGLGSLAVTPRADSP